MNRTPLSRISCMKNRLSAVLSAAFFLCAAPGGLAAAAAPSLAETGDLGKIVDSQGIASVRPKMGTRWSGGEKNLSVLPGD